MMGTDGHKHKRHRRLYRCPWCGREYLTLISRIDVGTDYCWHSTCSKCHEDYGMTHGVHRFLLSLCILVALPVEFLIVYLLYKYHIFSIVDHPWIILVLILATTIGTIIGRDLFSYYHARLVRIKDGHYVPYIYQGYMEIRPVDKKAKRLIKDGAILAVRYSGDGAGGDKRDKDGEDEREEGSDEFAFVLSDSIRKYKPTLWEWGYLTPEKVPDELFQEGREVVIVDNGRQIATAILTTIFEEFEKQPETEETV